MKKILNNKKGFTLVELIIVIAVIAILALIAIPSYMNVLKQAEEAKITAAARNAFSLAQVDLLTDKINNENAVLSTTIQAEVGMADADTFTIDIDADTYTVNYVTITDGGITKTVKAGEVSNTAPQA